MTLWVLSSVFLVGLLSGVHFAGTGAGTLVLAFGVARLARASEYAEALRAGMVCHIFLIGFTTSESSSS